MIQLEFADDDFTPIINGERAKPVRSPDDSPTGESGGCREVYITSEFVFKYDGIDEATLDIDEEDRKHFAMVVLADIERNWVIMERVNCVPRMCSREEFAVVAGVCRKYGINDIAWTDTFWGHGENKRNTHNWIVDNNGIPVIFDYTDHGLDEEGCIWEESDCLCIWCVW